MKKRYIFLALILITIGFGLFYLADRPEPKFFTPEPPNAPTADQQHYDLIVVGSDPEGIAAAVSGARNGLSTLLVDTRPVLGGLMTRGWLNTIDMNYDPNGDILNKGIFLEFFNQVEGDSFDVGTALTAFNKLVENEPNIQVLLDVQDIKPVVTEPQEPSPRFVSGVRVTVDGEEREFSANTVIDATQDADMAGLAGATYTLGQGDMGYEDRNMAVTPVFQLKGISNLDWIRLGVNLASERVFGTPHAGINLVSAWGFGDVMAKYQPSNEQVGIRGLNIGRQKDGTVLVNALHVYGIDPLDKEQLAEAYELAEQELPSIVEFIRQNIPGFDHAELVAVAPELYVRESRHIDGEYRLTVDDVLENKDFPDAIAYGSYPIDIQAISQDFKGAVVGVPEQYGVPLRSLIPKNVDGLMVVGRAASFDSLAHGSARVIPVGMATGQAAGAAVALGIEKNVKVRELSDSEYITELRERLNQQGMEIAPFNYKAPETEHWAYQGLKFVRSYGLVFGGYENDYRLDAEMSEQKFINLLSWVTQLAWPEETERPMLYTEGNELTIKDISYMLTQYLGKSFPTKDGAYQFLMEQDFFEPRVLQQIDDDNGKITNGTAYMILMNFIERGELINDKQ